VRYERICESHAGLDKRRPVLTCAHIKLGNGFNPDGSVPEHEYWPEYSPDFGLDVAAGNIKDQNDDAHLRTIEEASERWIERISAIMR
jgi:hypothetical protein